MNKKLVIVLLVIASLTSLFLNFYKKSKVPACLNADEAAFGYNAYSILKTGADEYGTQLPIRLKSFGDFKMPLYSYVSLPFIALFGQNEISIRLLNTTIAILIPFVIYLFVKELFSNKAVALLGSFLVSTNIALHIVGRQAHEGYLAVFLTSLSSLFFLRLVKKFDLANSIFFLISTLLLLFTYQSGRVFAFLFFILTFLYLFRKKIKLWFLVSLVFSLTIFGITDILYKPTRVTNLLFINNSGFANTVAELRTEGGSRLIYNKLTIGVKILVTKYLQYFSPQFLTINGDTNYRFGFPGLSPITFVEFFFFFVGIYYLFKNKERWKNYFLGLLLISPLTASLTWVDPSTTRTLFLFIPILIIGSYGAIEFIKFFKRKKYFAYLLSLILILQLAHIFHSWDFYFNHYPKRAVTIRSWQCGYKELVNYIRQNYDKHSKFYITKKHGQPYIFLLHFLQYPPSKYQKQAKLSPPDEYGFGQVESFDKFFFSIPNDLNEKDVIYIGYPDDLRERVPEKFVKKIKIGTEEIFWIYESPI